MFTLKGLVRKILKQQKIEYFTQEWGVKHINKEDNDMNQTKPIQIKDQTCFVSTGGNLYYIGIGGFVFNADKVKATTSFHLEVDYLMFTEKRII